MMAVVLLIDNYDSFVHNLARYVRELGHITHVQRNNLSIKTIFQLQPAAIIISPGPDDPDRAGVSLAVVQHFFNKIPILGVCLGHQVIAQAFGGRIVRALRPVHGKRMLITHDSQGLFAAIPNPCYVARYHSLVVERVSVPSVLAITAFSEEGEIMALRHRHYPIYGVQFHPESVLTERGYQLMKNFLLHT
jgi:anthranilate synthase component 2/para-aminobenzoate synthetase component 2